MNMKSNPYEICPVVENEAFLLRLVVLEDAEDLLPVYAQPNDSVEANSFNCTFGYGSRTLDEIKDFIRGWLDAYRGQYFIRWSVVDKNKEKAIGTIELFNQNNRGVLRLDLSGEYENTNEIKSILSLLLPDAFMWFGCESMITKVAPTAEKRMTALKEYGFYPTDEQVVGNGGVVFDGFWVLSIHADGSKSLDANL